MELSEVIQFEIYANEPFHPTDSRLLQCLVYRIYIFFALQNFPLRSDLEVYAKCGFLCIGYN